MSQSNRLAKAVLIASILAGVSYVASWNLGLPPAAELTWKGLGVALLALYAALNARTLDGWLLVVVMAFGALGDVLLGAAGLTVGALAFLAGHMVAIVLYLRNRRPTPSRSQLALAAVLVPAVVITAFLLPADRAGAPGVAVYSLGLALMAATAWLSRFSRYRVGIGAVMFVVSDLIIFGRNGPWPDNFATGLAVWGLYYFGQLLICMGVVGSPDAERPPLSRFATAPPKGEHLTRRRSSPFGEVAAKPTEGASGANRTPSPRRPAHPRTTAPVPPAAAPAPGPG